ncbi:hypothetical protein FB45DRAFT_868098 [Roridomyces roridus]|uniref:Uncharacterized protein n=1 Tax=Roridomyces roridus TaxID=1738132 RepID=A0AAD7BP63_9AGAR|nr:hypothetical protein FB45DRAFT_868098 [Roridomyces roridus]
MTARGSAQRLLCCYRLWNLGRGPCAHPAILLNLTSSSPTPTMPNDSDEEKDDVKICNCSQSCGKALTERARRRHYSKGDPLERRPSVTIPRKGRSKRATGTTAGSSDDVDDLHDRDNSGDDARTSDDNGYSVDAMAVDLDPRSPTCKDRISRLKCLQVLCSYCLGENKTSPCRQTRHLAGYHQFSMEGQNAKLQSQELQGLPVDLYLEVLPSPIEWTTFNNQWHLESGLDSQICPGQWDAATQPGVVSIVIWLNADQTLLMPSPIWDHYSTWPKKEVLPNAPTPCNPVQQPMSGEALWVSNARLIHQCLLGRGSPRYFMAICDPFWLGIILYKPEMVQIRSSLGSKLLIRTQDVPGLSACLILLRYPRQPFLPYKITL